MPGPARRSLADRFWEKVDRNGPTMPGMDTPCWEWTAALDTSGYGKIEDPDHPAGCDRASRVAWRLSGKTIPRGMYVLHRCDNRRCVRDEPGGVTHLYLGTHLDNMRDLNERGHRDGTHIARLNVEQPHVGSENGRAVMTEEIVRAVRRRAARGECRKDLAREYGVSDVAVGLAVRRVTWRHVA
jgi:HNH endonuclease